MLPHRSTNDLSSGRKQQTAVKQTVDRPKPQFWHTDSTSHRTHPYHQHQLASETNHWLKPPIKLLDETPELDLTCQEEMLTDAQLQSYPTQAYDPTAPLPLPAVRKRTTVLKKLPTPTIDVFQDADEDFIPSESDDDDDDDENYLPEHDRRPYNRTSHVNGHIGRGRGRGGRASHLNSTTASRFPPSTHFVRPQPESTSQTSTLSSTSNHRQHPLDSPDRSYASALTRFYGTRNGQLTNSIEYGDYRIKCSICGELSLNNMSFIAHLCSHFEDDLNYISPFDKIYRRCSVCHEEFSTPFQTLLHKDQEHLHETSEYRCRICQQTHSNVMDLFAHLNYVHVALDMPYFCDRCHYRTSMYEDMAYHIRQMHKGTPYFFCPYCFQSVLLPSMSDSNVLNSTPAYRHVILHFDRIENSNTKQQQQRRTESLFKYCNRCVLHVKSMKEHSSLHHSSNPNMNGQTSYDDGEENDFEELKRNHYHQTITSNHRSSPLKFDRNKQLPMATIRRRPVTSSNHEQVHMNNRCATNRMISPIHIDSREHVQILSESIILLHFITFKTCYCTLTTC